LSWPSGSFLASVAKSREVIEYALKPMRLAALKMMSGLTPAKGAPHGGHRSRARFARRQTLMRTRF
jgi:hypothetical protein